MPAISVIVPMYKVERYISKCLDSIINQSLKDIEVILINDGSPDNSGEIAEKYASSDDRIKVIHKKNGGASSARNEGLKHARGEYIGFVDADDWIDHNMYQTLYNAASKSNVDIVICDSTFVACEKEQRATFPLTSNTILNRKEIVNQVMRLFAQHDDRFSGSCNKIYRRELLLKNNVFYQTDLVIGEDWLFNLEVFNKSQQIIYLPENFYFYRRDNSESTSKQFKESIFHDRLVQHEYIKDMMRENCDWVQVVSTPLLAEGFCIRILECIQNEFSFRNNSSRKERREKIRKIINNSVVIEATQEMKIGQIAKGNITQFQLFLIKQRSVYFIELFFSILKQTKKVIKSFISFTK